MAKVEMSLNEYNEMKEELDFLRRVVKEITTPKYDEWTAGYYKNGQSYSVSSEVTEEVRNFLHSEVAKNVSAEFESCKVTPKFGSVTVAEVESPTIETEEVLSDEEVQ